MECGSEELFCQVVSFISENELATGIVVKVFGQTGETLSGIVGALSSFVAAHGEKLVGGAGFIFGVWRWWRYREQVLHKRLEEYLRESDRRLLDGQNYVLEAIERPRPGQILKQPLFAVAELVTVLREREWDRSAIAASVMRNSALQLDVAREKLERRLEAADARTKSLRQQLATTHMLSGAIASARAKEGLREQELNDSALNFFRSALQIPGHQSNAIAKEFECHQLRKLGDFTKALQGYQQLEDLANSIPDYRAQRLLLARAKRYRAEILQMQASTTTHDGATVFAGTAIGWQLMKTDNESVLSIRNEFAPYSGWELLDQADCHYLTAFLARNRNWGGVQQEQLIEAQTAYRGVLAALPKSRFRQNRRDKKLRQNAIEGIARVDQAIAGQGEHGGFDVSWLLK